MGSARRCAVALPLWACSTSRTMPANLVFGTHCGRLDHQPPIDAKRFRQRGLPGRTSIGRASPGDRAHVDGSLTLDDQTVGGDGLTRPHHKPLLLSEFARRDQLFGAVGERRDVFGAERGQCPQRPGPRTVAFRLEYTGPQPQHGDTGGNSR